MTCGEILRSYADKAEKLYNEDIVCFGYIDVFVNDHPLIEEPIAPYFLIFESDNLKPTRVAGDKFDALFDTIYGIINKNKEASEHL